MNSATDKVEAVKGIISDIVWSGPEVSEGQVFGPALHMGYTEEEIEIAIGEMLDGGEIVSTIIQTSSGFLPGLRQAVLPTTEERESTFAEIRRSQPKPTRCESFEKELMLARM